MGVAMADDSVDFASMLVSRLCHDLLSPVGSFGNGLELLADENDPDMRDNVIALLNASALSAINKLKYFRMAFGSAGGYGDSLSPDDLDEALGGLVPPGRDTTIEWISPREALPKGPARLLLLLGMTIVEALLRGGTISVAVERRGEGIELALRGAGPRVIIDEQLVTAFATAPAEPSPKTITVALAHRIAAASGGAIMLSRPAEGEIVVGAVLPRI